jgi:hypothetical protein
MADLRGTSGVWLALAPLRQQTRAMTGSAPRRIAGGGRRLGVPSLAVVLLLLGLAGCGGGSGGNRPDRTSSPTRSITASVPAVPTPSRSRTPSTSESAATPTSETPTSETPTLPTSSAPTSAAPTRTSAAPTPTPTPTRTSEQPSSPSETPTPSESPTTAAAAAAGDSNEVPTLLLLALLVVAVAAAASGFAILARRRARLREWADGLDAARSDAQRFVRDVLPSLLAGSADARHGGWEVARPQVTALEDRLAGLVEQAPDPGRAGDVAGLRQELDAATRAPAEEEQAALGSVGAAASRLEELLAAPAVPGPAEPPGPTEQPEPPGPPAP